MSLRDRNEGISNRPYSKKRRKKRKKSIGRQYYQRSDVLIRQIVPQKEKMNHFTNNFSIHFILSFLCLHLI